MNTYDLCEELSQSLTADDILLVGSSCMAVRIFGKHYYGIAKMFESNKGQGAMGAMIPVAIAYALASGMRIVCVDGEGSFMQNIQELEVVHRMNLNITFFVINNGGYASIHNSENRWFSRISEGATFPRIQLIARAYGLYSADATSFGLFFDDCLRKWRGPQAIEVCVPHDEQPPARDNA